MKDLRLKLKAVAAAAGVVAFMVLMGIAGDYDYAEQVVLRMTCAEYDWVKDTLTKQKNGRKPSEREIAHWWAEHHSEYKE